MLAVRCMLFPFPLHSAIVSHIDIVESRWLQRSVLTRSIHVSARSDSMILTAGLAVAGGALATKYIIQVFLYCSYCLPARSDGCACLVFLALLLVGVGAVPSEACRQVQTRVSWVLQGRIRR